MCFVGGKGYELASSTPGLNCTLLYKGGGDVKGYATWLKTYPTLSQTIVFYVLYFMLLDPSYKKKISSSRFKVRNWRKKCCKNNWPFRVK